MSPEEVKPSFKEFANPSDASVDKLVAALDRAYHSPVRMFFRAFFQGLAAVLGGTVGASVIFALLFYLLTLFNVAPLGDKLLKLIIPERIFSQLEGNDSTSATSTTLSPALRTLIEDSAQRAYQQGITDAAKK